MSGAVPVRRWPAALLLALAPGLALAALAPLVPAPPAEPTAPPPPWVYAGLPQQQPPPTRFSLAPLDGQAVLRVEAERSYGNLLHPLPGTPAGRLSWRWRVDRALPAADLRSKAGDDAALKVCAMFELPRERVPFVERQLLRLAESRLGEPLPNATVCYVWDNAWPAGSVVPNAYSRRLRFITLGGAVGSWQAVSRDLAADFLRTFGDEAATVPPLRAIAVGADADNTGGHSLGFIDALRLEPAVR
jgi:hypothetical protein